MLGRRPPAIELVREFLKYTVWGAEPEDVEAQVKSFHKVNPFEISQTIDALEQLVADPLPEGVLSTMVMIDGNQMLMEESDDGARAWLKDLAAQMRRWTSPP